MYGRVFVTALLLLSGMDRTIHRGARQHKRAGFALLGRRVAAYLVDILLLFVVLAPAGQLILRLLDAPLPQTGPEVARVILWNFSLPAWLYFILGDQSASGATLGKRLLKIQVRDLSGERLSIGRALARTAVKLLPWELVHVSAFALSADLSQFSPMQIAGLAAANLLTVVYLGVAVATRGRRSVHDYVAGTLVRPKAADSAREPSPDPEKNGV
jgi:uncharacterized RDD family membrane protein YckC